MKPRLFLDVDGVVANFVRATLGILSGYAGRQVLEQEIVMWDVSQILEDHESRERSKKDFEKAGFAATFELYDGAQEAVAEFKKVTDLYFVTAPMMTNPTWMQDRAQWLVRHFDVPANRICFITDKFVLQGDIMIDDSPKNIEGFLKTNPEGCGLLWERPYNKDDSTQGKRVHSWAEAAFEINEWIQKHNTNSVYLPAIEPARPNPLFQMIRQIWTRS